MRITNIDVFRGELRVASCGTSAPYFEPRWRLGSHLPRCPVQVQKIPIVFHVAVVHVMRVDHPAVPVLRYIQRITAGRSRRNGYVLPVMISWRCLWVWQGPSIVLRNEFTPDVKPLTAEFEVPAMCCTCTQVHTLHA